MELGLGSVIIEEATEGEIWEENAERALAEEVTPSSLEEALAEEAVHLNIEELLQATLASEEVA